MLCCAVSRLFPLWVAACVLALCPCFAAAQDDGDTREFALVGVSVVDVERGVVVPGQTVVVRDGLVAAVLDGDAHVPVGVRRIDAAGLFAIPGLIDSHVHYVMPEVTHPMMVAHGIAMVRDMGGFAEQILALRDAMNTGEFRSPRMLAVGPIFDGNPPIWPFSEVCETPEEGRAAVRKIAALGADQIKVYSRLKPEVYRAIGEEAKAQGLAMVGHVPLAVDVNEAVEAGHRTIEHLTGFDGLFAERFDPSLKGSKSFLARSQSWAMLGDLTNADLAKVAEPFARGGVVQCPTLVVMRGIMTYAAGDDEPMLKYVPAMMKQFWSNGNSTEWGKAMKAQLPGMQRFVGVMHRAGVPIIAGTDLGNPNVIAGHSLHVELELLVESGLKPIDALRAATSTPAALFDLDGPGGLGSIEPGREATLLLVTGNPLEDITATRAIRSVVHRGEYLDRDALDVLLTEAELAATGETEAAPTDTGFDLLALDMPGEPVASGVYTLDFGGFAAGTESFRINKTQTGYQLAVHNQPKGPGQVPYSLVLNTDADGVFESATYTTLGNTPQTSRYRREGDTLIAEKGDERQEVELAGNALIAGPAIVTDFCTLQRLDIEVSQSQEHTSYSFGYPDWKWSAVPNTVIRLKDDPSRGADATNQAPAGKDAEPLRVFRQVLNFPGFGRIEITSTLDSQGVPSRTITKMPFGTISSTRGPLEDSHTTPGS